MQKTPRITFSGALSFPNGVRDIKDWCSYIKKPLILYNKGLSSRQSNYPHNLTVKIICQEFRPLDTDPLSKKWKNGEESVVLNLPAFAIAKGQKSATERSLDQFLRDNRRLLFDLAKESGNRVIEAVLSEAVRYAEKVQISLQSERPGVADVLRAIWSEAHLIYAPLAGFAQTASASQVVSLLGFPRLRIHHRPTMGEFQSPPVLDAQIDQIWMAKMKKLKKKVLAELKMKILGRDRKDWYPTFLTTFTLISNLETLYENQNRQLVRYCEKVCIVTCSSMNNG